MRKLERIPVAKLRRDESQPRKHFDEAVIAGLAESIKTIGLQVPLIVFPDGEFWKIGDGETRFRAMLVGGITEAECMVLDKRPTAAELAIIRLSIDVNRTSLTPSERSRALGGLLEVTGSTVSAVCKQIGISQSLGSKLLALQKLAPEILAKVDAGQVDIEKAYIISSEPDHAKQLAMLTDAGTLSRDGLRKRVRGVTTGDEVKLTSATFTMPGGYVICLRGGQVDLNTAVEVMSETVRILKKGLQNGISLASQMKVMKDTAKVVK